jgi:hypothetical protein
MMDLITFTSHIECEVNFGVFCCCLCWTVWLGWMCYCSTYLCAKTWVCSSHRVQLKLTVSRNFNDQLMVWWHELVQMYGVTAYHLCVHYAYTIMRCFQLMNMPQNAGATITRIPLTICFFKQLFRGTQTVFRDRLMVLWHNANRFYILCW